MLKSEALNELWLDACFLNGALKQMEETEAQGGRDENVFTRLVEIQKRSVDFLLVLHDEIQRRERATVAVAGAAVGATVVRCARCMGVIDRNSFCSNGCEGMKKRNG